eukprot:4008039-Pleurochrysis_carterae.AAC.1
MFNAASTAATAYAHAHDHAHRPQRVPPPAVRVTAEALSAAHVLPGERVHMLKCRPRDRHWRSCDSNTSPWPSLRSPVAMPTYVLTCFVPRFPLIRLGAEPCRGGFSVQGIRAQAKHNQLPCRSCPLPLCPSHPPERDRRAPSTAHPIAALRSARAGLVRRVQGGRRRRRRARRHATPNTQPALCASGNRPSDVHV